LLRALAPKKKGSTVDFAAVRHPAAKDWRGVALCPNRAAKNRVGLDHDTLIWDGKAAEGWPVVEVLCLGLPVDGSGDCGGGIPSGVIAALTASVVVGDSAAGVMPVPGFGFPATVGCVPVTGRCTDAAGTRWYTNRAIAGANENWPAVDFRGTPCCAAPYLPPRMIKVSSSQ